eukprot:9452931-Ditylum_brightwellii.AAC.1
MYSATPFGSVTVLLIGDPAQLPPVQRQASWNYNSSNTNDLKGFNVYKLFSSVVELVESNKLDRSDPGAVLLYDFLQRLRNEKTLKRIGIS